MCFFPGERTAYRAVVLLAVAERAVVDLKVSRVHVQQPANSPTSLDGTVMAGRGILGNEIHRALQFGSAGNSSTEPLPIVAQDNVSDIELTIAIS